MSLAKQAAADSRPEAPRKEGRKALGRAVKDRPGFTGERTLASMAVPQAASSAALHAAGMATNPIAHAGFWPAVASAKQDRRLRSQGVKQRPFGSPKMTDEAKKKYLSDKYKGGGHKEKKANLNFFDSKSRFAKDPKAHRLSDIGRDLALNTPGTGIVQGPGAKSLFAVIQEELK